MTIIHIVLFDWKSTATAEQIQEAGLQTDACNQMLALGNKCIHPTTQTPYIKSFSGGKNNSPEGQAKDPYTHAFVVEFASPEDRDYYVFKDPAHQEFVKFVGGLANGAKVVDYEPGKI